MRNCKWILVMFVASWTAHWWAVGICPGGQGIVNPYTGEPQYPTAVNAMNCYVGHEKEMTQRFKTKADAEKFFEACPETGDGMGITCTNKRIEKLAEPKKKAKK